MSKRSIASRALHALVVLLVVVSTAGVATVATGSPAAAEHGRVCSHFTSEADWADNASETCRGLDVVQPARGQLLTRADLVRASATYTHPQLGFTQGFLWYANESLLSVREGRGPEWTYCVVANRDARGICRPGEVETRPEDTGLVGAGFDNDVTLHVLGDQTHWIAYLCGNSIVPNSDVPDYRVDVVADKFYDRNRDGVRQSDEQGLAGFDFQLHRVSSLFGDQQPGQVDVTASDANGAISFPSALVGPGVYEVRELPREGFVATTPTTRTVTIGAGGLSRTVHAGEFGNVETRADVVKVDFRLVDAPTKMDADTPVDFDVRAVVENRGPADLVEVIDGVTVTVPEDCTATPARQEQRLWLREGEPVELRFPVRVVCTDPSDHPMTFSDDLTIVTPGVTDPDLVSNTVAFQHVPEVFDYSDLAVTEVTTSCAARTDVDVPALCTVTGMLLNRGPHNPTTGAVELSLSAPSDCLVALAPGEVASRASLPLPLLEPVAVTAGFLVTCADRSYHPVAGAVSVRPDERHVKERAAGDESASSPDVIEVFEEADLAINLPSLVCSEREASTTAATCTVTAVASNAGPADGVQAVVDLVVTPAPGCTADPVVQTRELVLAAGGSSTLTATWRLLCPGSKARHSVLVTASIRNATTDPHAEDRDLTDNSARLLWQPSDTKPRSLPSAVNIGKQGLVPFAVLSTATYNAVAQVDPATLLFGATGTEDSVRSCATVGEDVNDDGRADLVCHAETQLTGISCATTTTTVTGFLRDGTAFTSQDDVMVTPCRR